MFPVPESARRAGRPCDISDLGHSQPGLLVDTTAPRSRGPRWPGLWSTTQTLSSRVRVGQGELVDHATSRTLGPSQPAQLVDPSDPLSWGPSRLGQLVHPVAARTPDRVCRDSWSTPWRHGHGTESAGRAGLPIGSSDPGPSHPGQLVDPTVTWTQCPNRQGQLVEAGCPRTLGHRIESPGTAGRPHGPSDQGSDSAGTSGRPRGPLEPGPCRPGKLVEPVAHRTRERVGRDNWSTSWHLATQQQVSQDIWSTPRPLGPRVRVGQDSWLTTPPLGLRTESARTAGRHHGSSDRGPSQLGELVNESDPRSQGPCQLGEQVDPVAARTRDRVGRDSWETPQLLGHGTVSAGTAGRTCSSSDPGSNSAGIACRPCPPLDPQTRGLVGRDNCSTPRHLGPGVIVGWDSWSTTRPLGLGTKSAGTAGRPLGSSDPGLRRLEQQVDWRPLRPGVRVGRESWSTPWPHGPGVREGRDSWSTPQPLGSRVPFSRDCWSTLQLLGSGTKSAGKVVNPATPRTLGPGTKWPGIDG